MASEVLLALMMPISLVRLQLLWEFKPKKRGTEGNFL